MSSKTSFINGSAVVVFGGGIAVSTGYNTQNGNVVVAFSEMVEQLEAGADIDDNEPTYGIQVQLVFDNLKSIEICRRALDVAERMFKDQDYKKEVPAK